MVIEQFCWSVMPPDAYAVEIDGERYGIGLNPVFGAVAGSWNIMNLSCTVLDSLLPWVGEPEGFPLAVGALPAAVATALQYYDSATTIGELAASTQDPREFLRKILGRTDLITARLYGDVWWLLAAKRAETLVVVPQNVVRVDFSRNRGLH